MPAYVLSIVSGYHPDVYFCSVRESSGSRLFFIIFRRLSIGSHVVHCPACHAVINYLPFKERKLLFILHFCRIFAATLPPAGPYLRCRPAKPVPFDLYCSRAPCVGSLSRAPAVRPEFSLSILPNIFGLPLKKITLPLAYIRKKSYLCSIKSAVPMKRLVSILLLIACFATSFVQAQDTIPNLLEDDDVIINDDVLINIKRYVCMPEYPGGEQALVEYLSANVHYPEQAVKDSIEGRVVVGFSLQADLSVTNVVVLQSSGSALLDEEAIRVVRSMPKWECKSEPCYIDVKYTVPLNFKFE